MESFRIFTSLRYDGALSSIVKRGWAHARWNSKNDVPLYMLDFHRDRMLRAATYWGWTPAVAAISGLEGLDRLISIARETWVAEDNGEKPLRLRFYLAQDGGIQCEAFATPPMPLENLLPARLPPPGDASAVETDPAKEPSYEVVLDEVETARSEYTHYKTTKRAMYDSARVRANIGPTENKEVLIINADDRAVMEGSTTTPYFWRNGRWVTPPVPKLFSREEGSGGNDGTTRRYALEGGLAVEEAVQAESLVDGEECWISNGVRGFIHGKIRLG